MHSTIKVLKVLAAARAQKLRAIEEFRNIEQILGRALGYPRFCDDQKNFPGALDQDGVCIGDHVALTLAQEAAETLRKLR